MPDWNPALTSRTRVYPSADWAASTSRENLKRVLRRIWKNDDQSKAVTNRMAAAVTRSYASNHMFDNRNYLNRDDQRREEHLLEVLAVGTMDKMRQGAFFA